MAIVVTNTIQTYHFVSYEGGILFHLIHYILTEYSSHPS